jgi:hypothetical protein
MGAGEYRRGSISLAAETTGINGILQNLETVPVDRWTILPMKPYTGGEPNDSRRFMSTKPTKLQTQARDHLADALNMIVNASRLDGRAPMDSVLFAEIAARVARASSAFRLEEIFTRALERRALALGMSVATAEMITLVETEIRPLEMLLLDDEAFRALAARLDEELGEI